MGCPTGKPSWPGRKLPAPSLPDIPTPFGSSVLAGLYPKGAPGEGGGQCTRAWGACPWLTPLETAWQKYCIQSAMSSSFSALSSRDGRSVRITWKEWGRSVALERRHPPHCSPLGERGEDGDQQDRLASTSLKTASVCPPCTACHPFSPQVLVPIHDIP